MTDGLLAGKRAFITGGGNGMGRSASQYFAAEGASVAVVDIDPAAAAETVANIKSSGGKAVAIHADVALEDSVEAAVAQAVQAWGGLDVIVPNAAVQLAGQDARVHELSLEVWQRTIAINLTGAFLTSKHGIRALLAAGGGSVVCTCSPTSLYGLAPGYSAYSASKAGVYGLVRVMAADYARLGIRVNGVIPGYTRTPMTTWVTADEAAVMVETIPLGRAGEPDEVAKVIAFLASDLTPYVTGAVWAADGGWTAV
jgi:NAD(P)-dependent dehydrogenase (short-subunit alcohol dehydrogenase family)